MSIQSDINQTVGMASALLSINPSVQEAAKKRSELRSVDKQLSANTELQKEVANRPTTKDYSGMEDKLDTERRDLLEQKFRLKPTAENLRKLKEATPISIPEDPDDNLVERLNDALSEGQRQAEIDYTYTTAYNEEYAKLANRRAAKAVDTKSKLKNEYYFGGKRINDVLGQQAVEQLAKKERENE